MHLIEIGIEPSSASDAARLTAALGTIARFDGRFAISTDEESGQSIVAAASESDLNDFIDVLRSTFELEVRVGAPQIAYRETISAAATIRYTHKRVLGGAGQFADVTVAFETLPASSDFIFENAMPHGALPPEFVKAVEKGLRARKESGLLAGFPVVDFKARLIDAKYHEVDSNELTFDIAARAAFRELASKNVAQLLEPIMKVVVMTPDDFVGGVIGDLKSRRGQIQGVDSCGSVQIILVLTPLATMFAYGKTLQSMTQDRARFNMTFDHHAPIDPPFDDEPFPPAVGLRA